MNEEQKNRLKALKERFCTRALITELYGIDFPDENLIGHLKVWGHQFYKKDDLVKPDGAINRHALELFFQACRLLPMKLAAARLGMGKDSFMAVLTTMKREGMDYGLYDIEEQTIQESYIRKIHKNFSELSRTIFGNHSDYCERLHQAIKNYLDIEVEPLHCITSEALKQDPLLYAYEFDVITLEPVGLEYSILLDFKKPIRLRPDSCSMKLYARESDILREFVLAGAEPELPDGL